MAEIRGLATGGERCFKEAVLLNANRVYDSCSDKDCLSELQVYFTETAGNVIDNSSFVRFKDAECINVCMNVEAVPFNKGFYSVELTYYFEITLEACTSPSSPATTVKGLAVASKRVILYGGEGGVRVFTSVENPTSCGCNSTEVGGSLSQGYRPGGKTPWPRRQAGGMLQAVLPVSLPLQHDAGTDGTLRPGRAL